mmetsp:Transcript_7913/g.22662  ORF Transcript_7913/g.22662 Transcript_7913/m.22662 type:complete len:430 (-) Transcript_7913:1684-2973(-)
MASTDVAVIGGGLSALHSIEELAKAGVKVTACMGNPFIEFAIAGALFVSSPEKYNAWMSEPDSFKVQGVDYMFDEVTEIDPAAKTIKFARSPPLRYRAVIVASGSRLPLVCPAPGSNLAQRRAELEAAGKAIAGAKTVVLNGSGTVGVELAGDIKAAHPNVEVVLLARSGTILNGDPLAPSTIKAVSTRLSSIGVRVVKGSAPPSPEWMEYKLSPGKMKISDGEVSELSFDVYIPTFAQRPNTQFLDRTEALNERKQIIANECLQSTVYPEIFGVNTTDQKLLGHPVSSRLAAQAKTCVANAQRVLKGQAPTKHVDKEMPPPMPVPMNIKVGHGPNGYMLWNQEGLPGILSFCCCLPCGGGFPFCPPPCCWCCCPTLCGTCCGVNGGSGAAAAMESIILPMFPGNHGFKGVTGKALPMVPPKAQEGFTK